MATNLAALPNVQISVLVSDSNAMGCHLLDEALRRANFAVTGIANSADQLARRLEERIPNVTLLSANLSDGRLNGFKALRAIRNSQLNTRVVMILEERDRELIIGAFRGGARGVFFREEPFATLCKCIQMVHEGQIWAGSKELEIILEALATAAPLRAIESFGSRALSKREADIAFLVAQGLSNREIAHRTYLSEHTIKNYVFRIFDKLNVSNRVELALQLTPHREKETA